MKPKKLPIINYPTASENEKHNLQPLPDVLPIFYKNEAEIYRSNRNKIISTEKLNNNQILTMARIIAESFSIKEPMARHLVPPLLCPKEVFGSFITDPFGNDSFGEWTKKNILFWLIRLLVLTKQEKPEEEIIINKDAIRLSLTAINESDEIIGGAFNVTLSHEENNPEILCNNTFYNAVLSFFEPILNLLNSQESESLEFLSNKYPDFYKALKNGKVGNHFMIARSPLLASEDTFELFISSAERFYEFGYEYMVTSAANQWTGAAAEIVGGVRVHYAPYRSSKQVLENSKPHRNIVSSTDGFLSDKDSGCMFYVIKLK